MLISSDNRCHCNLIGGKIADTLRDEFLGGQLCLCYNDQVSGQLVPFAFVTFPHPSNPLRFSHSMLLMVASSSFISHQLQCADQGSK